VNQAIDRSRSEYEAAGRALEERFLRDQNVDAYLDGHTELVETLVVGICNPVLARPDLALLATAGFGRREQFPQSDVDLLFVHGLKDESSVEGVLAPALNRLWDVRLVLGHQVWSIYDFRHLNMDDYEFILALFNARFLAGNPALAEKAISGFHAAFVREHARDLADRIVAGVRKRHEQFANTIYQLEPDLKEAPGGLRDHLAACWLKRLVGNPTYMPNSVEEVEEAHRFLKQLRVLLHLEHRRTDNRLTHPMQEAVARRMVKGQKKVQASVEALMKEYFINARRISGFCLAMVHTAQPEEIDRPLTPEEIPTLDDLSGILEAFLLSMEEGRPLSDEVRNAISSRMHGGIPQIDFPKLRQQIGDLFRPRAGLYRALSDLYQLGVLETLFPEFESIRARVIRDFYHKYTVDEHTLIAIKCIEDLVTGDPSADARFGTIVRDTVRPADVTLSLLLHDVGKGGEEEHTEEGARIAAKALRRFKFGRDEIETVVFLIRNHLAMSSVVFRRDIDDDKIVRRFADLVGTPERLRLLTLLTYADIKAVAPGVLNDWKKDLLWQLYLETYRKLTLEYGDRRIERSDMEQQLLDGVEAEGLDPTDFQAFLRGFPTRYLTSTPAVEIYEHFRMARRVSTSNPVELSLHRRQSHYELAVTTPDRKRLFAKIVGLLSYFEMNILRGFAFANLEQTILDIFHFSDDRRTFRHPEERERFRNLLVKAVADEVSVQTLLRGKETSVLFRRRTPGFEPMLYFEDDPSGRYTIVEIIAPDALGLLYRIGHEIAGLECDIDLALISTEGDKAVDVFYLCRQGGKLPREIQSELRSRIVAAIGPS